MNTLHIAALAAQSIASGTQDAAQSSSLVAIAAGALIAIAVASGAIKVGIRILNTLVEIAATIGAAILGVLAVGIVVLIVVVINFVHTHVA